MLIKLGLVALLLFKEDAEFLVEELDGLELAVGFRFGQVPLVYVLLKLFNLRLQLLAALNLRLKLGASVFLNLLLKLIFQGEMQRTRGEITVE